MDTMIGWDMAASGQGPRAGMTLCDGSCRHFAANGQCPSAGAGSGGRGVVDKFEDNALLHKNADFGERSGLCIRRCKACGPALSETARTAFIPPVSSRL